ncbi:type II toxin-antitoxin system VapB family antitoxin [Pacificimonas sp. WHA3]|uniref:Type II toxin-antitoxin system VapB family antitoxin n=1 Tax=Pacificimonas pallii TaxID=2827236 RepID=A0ABS6SAI8_9SPHN|nr:type II toxin-antitoxin system VapB family antitoxin [Pacificimonas pallii]
MRATVTIDNDFIADAKELSGIETTSELLRTALRALVERHA